MAAEVMIQIGSFQFSIDTAAYQSLQRAKGYRWVAQDRINRRPAQQFVGLGSESISLAGIIYPGVFGTLDQISKMREVADTGEPLNLVVSPNGNTGEILGLWVILSISETNTIFIAGGVPRKIEFTMEIAHYGDDSDSSSASPVFGESLNDSFASILRIFS